MPIPTHSRSIRLGDLDCVAEALLNNCSDLWTATVTSTGKLLATGAGTTPEGAMANAITAAEHKLGTPARS